MSSSTSTTTPSTEGGEQSSPPAPADHVEPERAQQQQQQEHQHQQQHQQRQIEHYNNDATYFRDLLNSLPIGKLYPELIDKSVPILEKWRTALPRSAWSKLMKKTQGPHPRVVKELNEAAPVIQRVLEFLEKYKVAAGQEAEQVAAGQEAEQGTTPSTKSTTPYYTIVDLGCGLGILSMFLSELLNAASSTTTSTTSQESAATVKEFYLVDKMWPQTRVASTNSDGLHMTRDHIDLVDWPIPLRTLKMDIKKGRDLADLVHYIFENGRKEDRGSGNRIGNVDHVEVDGVEAVLNGGKSDAGTRGSAEVIKVKKENIFTRRAQQAQQAQPPRPKNQIILLGVHLCGSLSLRFVELVNKNPETVRFAALKPCCLPGKMHLHHEMLYRVGNHEFTARDIYFPEEAKKMEQLVCEEVGEKGGKPDGAAEVEPVAGVLLDDNDLTDSDEEENGGMVNWDGDGGLDGGASNINKAKQNNKPASSVGEVEEQGASTSTAATPSTSTSTSSSSSEDPTNPNGKPSTSTTSKPEAGQRAGGHTLSGRGRKRFGVWCQNVFQCLDPRLVSPGDASDNKDNAGASAATFETHKVAPHYFQDKFIFVERNNSEMFTKRKQSQEQLQTSASSLLNTGLVYNEADRAFRNQILIPRYQRKRELAAAGGDGAAPPRREKIRAKRKANDAKTSTANVEDVSSKLGGA
ncbi:unnamed protein product [Amoebophrya sp. A25]|nr:unnamed protein product [Amoebophrya sp. A25]|eukprot:GSA25T00003382001.1